MDRKTAREQLRVWWVKELEKRMLRSLWSLFFGIIGTILLGIGWEEKIIILMVVGASLLVTALVLFIEWLRSIAKVEEEMKESVRQITPQIVAPQEKQPEKADASAKITCSYCGISNPPNRHTCTACGGRLE